MHTTHAIHCTVVGGTHTEENRGTGLQMGDEGEVTYSVLQSGESLATRVVRTLVRPRKAGFVFGIGLGSRFESMVVDVHGGERAREWREWKVEGGEKRATIIHYDLVFYLFIFCSV